MASGSERMRAIYDRHGEPLRFLVVGVWNTAFSYMLFAFMRWAFGPSIQGLSNSELPSLAWLGEHWYLVVQWAAWALSVPQSATSLKLLVFHSKGHWGHEIARSYLVYLPLQLLSTGLLWFFVTIAGFHPLLGQLLVAGIVAALSYLGNKHFTFKTPNVR